MRVLRRALAGLAVLLLVVAAGVAGVLWWSLPGSAISADIPGLSAPVHVGIDADGVPHIAAATALDGAAALGFMHARDRTMQMELMRRAASGRLSELVGSSTLRLDRFMRVVGLRRRAEAEVAELDGGTRAMLDAYARGVNAWFARRGRFSAFETVLTGTPEPWTPVDSLLWGKTMALYLAGNWQSELARAALLQRMAPEQVRALWPSQDATPPPDARVGPAATRLGVLVPRFPEPFTLPDTASNEWAVDAAHSATGAPLLAGDPHLAYSAPGIWYLARIDTPEGTLAGATAPGMPFLVLGHNGRIAWTFTTTGADTQDVFVETVLPDGRYATPDGSRPFATRTERIVVRGGADEVLTVRETRHGPVLSDLDATAGPVMAMAMAELAPHDTAADGLLALNRAGTVAEAMAAAGRITSPVQNMLVADRAGIALATTGRIPVRRAGDGTLPQPGADGAHDWTGFASGAALPRFVHPASGILVNANERTAGPDFPVFMGQDWFGDWRARRIRALLDRAPRHTVEDFAAMQTDATSAFAQAVLPRLLQTAPADEPSRAALDTLRGWDGGMWMDATQPLLFNDWMRRLAAALQERSGVPAGLGGVQPDLIARALGSGEAQWCGPACGALLAGTLSAAAHDHAAAAVRWGDVHAAVFAHPVLGRLPVIGPLFTWRIPQPGDGETLFRGGMRGANWDAVHGASFRGIYDLADLDGSIFALAPGQSGHPLRAGMANLLGRWVAGDTLHLPRAVTAAETVDLTPAQSPSQGH